ncbi:MAG: MFS transporter, partial [Desulfobacterales bacterium]|nr:MFS transporter [Desulfobacterales bacterium]
MTIRHSTEPIGAAWSAVALLWVVAFLNYIDRQVIFSVFPLLKSEMALNDFQLGLLSAVFLWVYGFASPLGGYCGDRFGRKRTIVVSLLVWTAVTLATGFARSFPELIAARALMGISEASYIPAALALISDHHQGPTRSLATGLHQSGLYAGIVGGGELGGWIAQHYGWRTPFFVLGVAGIAYAGIVAFGLREAASRLPARPADHAPFLASLRAVLRLPGFSAILGAFSIFAIGNWIVYTWMPLYLYQKFGMSLTAAGFSATFYIQAG